MKYVLIIGDGMADNPVPSLQGLTPLEAANKPIMDSLAKQSELGTAVSCPPGLEPGSDIAVMTIFGCDPRKLYFGRAPLEAAAMGIDIPDNAAAYRCNMACVLPGGDGTLIMKSHSAGGIDGESADRLIVDLSNDPQYARALLNAGVTVYPSGSYRHIAVMRNSNANDAVTFTPHDNLGRQISDILPSGGRSAQLLRSLTELSISVLNNHQINRRRVSEGKLPANCAWFWAGGTAAKLPSFRERYNKSGAMISAVPLCKGIAALQGLEVINVPGATGELDTDYEAKAAAALDAFSRGLDFVTIHVEAPDECTHIGDTQGKVKAIEFIDSRVLRPLIDGLHMMNEEFRILLLSDHYTLSESGAHDGEPTPFLIYDSNNLGLSDEHAVFSEQCCQRGSFLHDGTSLMNKLFNIK